MPSEPTTLGLERLMAQVAAGDQAAFSDLYDQTAAMIYGLIRRVVRSSAQAEEVTQEVYLQVWQRAGNFDPQRGSVRAWMATLAHRRAVDAVRQSQSAIDREARVSIDPPGADVAEAAVLRDEHDRVRAALSSLTDLQFEALELAYFGGLTYREVAERLGAPLGTVKARMRDGLLRLRTMMDDEHG